MAKRRKKGGLLLGLAGLAVLGAIGYGTLSDGGGKKVTVADPGGGSIPASAGPEAPYAIHTLPPVGTAAQDPGGGGGGGNTYSPVGTPGIQGAQGSGSAQRTEGSSDTLYLSGVNLIDPNRSAATSGDNTFPTPGTAANPLANTIAGSSGSGCDTSSTSVGYYAIPLKVETLGFNGAPHVHVRISGSGPLMVTFFQQSPSGACQAIASGSTTISGATTDLNLTSRKFQFSKNFTPVLVFNAPSGSHTISTDSDNPSSLRLPGLYGV